MNQTAEQVHAWSDDELRVKIAEALGWKWSEEIHIHNIEYLEKQRDDLRPMRGAWRYSSHEDIVYIPDDGPMPNWPRDLNAAAELTQYAQSKGAGFEVCDLYHHADKSWSYCCTIYDSVSNSCNKYESYAATEPRARAEAWYLWWLATNGGKNE